MLFLHVALTKHCPVIMRDPGANVGLNIAFCNALKVQKSCCGAREQ